MSVENEQAALEQLRKQGNPFEDLVRPQRPDDRFEDLHVEEVLHEPRQCLFEIIDSFRLQDYSSYRDLHPTRAIMIFGARGAGKTHLLESLVQRTDARQLILRRETDDYDGSIHFEEYMHQHLVRGLLARDAVHGYRPFDAIAAQLTRKILLHAVRELSPTDRLFATAPARWQWLRLLWFGGGEQFTHRFDEFALELEHPDSARRLNRIAERHNFHVRQLAEFALARIVRYEDGQNTLSIIRREFYRALVRTALLDDKHALTDFLEAEYRPTDARAISRSDVVRQLLKVMAEACALVRLPVVFAVDNLEGFLAPLGIIDIPRTRAFFEGLAQTIDYTSGFLFLIFAEDGFYTEEVRKHLSRFVESRLQIGVRPPNRGLVHTVNLHSLTTDELRMLISGRMKGIRDGSAAVPTTPIFPFSEQFVADEGNIEHLSIRQKLERLRDAYDRLVFNKESAVVQMPLQANDVVSDETERAALLERVWKEKLREAGRILESSLSSSSADLTRGLGMLLQAALPLPESTVVIEHVVPSVTIGDDPRYGFAVLLTCKFPESDDGKPVQVGLGFLLARGSGMAIDLRSKFDVFTNEDAKADMLIVLWVTDRTGANLASQLPSKTGSVWQSAANKTRSSVRAVGMEDLRKIRAFSPWLAEVRNQDERIPHGLVRDFVHQKCASIFRLVDPPRE